MQVARAVFNDEHLCCGQQKFENIKEISYLGSQMNQTNSISSEFQARIPIVETNAFMHIGN
jgi:hypothetical protein